ncbi:MAG: hypothetical protein AAF146_18770 [Bacteroidota bacterium]
MAWAKPPMRWWKNAWLVYGGEYAQRQEDLLGQQEQLATEFDQQIWKQLDQYLRDFVDREGYDYVIGDRQDGTIIGGRPAYDCTDEIIHYVNQRYAGLEN